MNETQQVLIDILANQMFRAGVRLPEKIDWHALLTEARQQTVFPLVYSCVKDRMPEGEEKEYAEKQNLTLMAGGIRNLHYHKELHKLLSSHQIPYVILKGQASAMCYPEPMLRTMGDIDFLVDREDMTRADRLLTAEGFQKLDGADKHEHHWAYRKRHISLELHWDVPGIPQNDRTIHACLADILEKAKPLDFEDGICLVPSPFHHGLILLLHTISHLTGSGVGLRHLCDWLVFENSLTENEFNSLFSKPLQDVGLWSFAKVLTKIGVMFFGCAERAWCADADDALCASFLEDVLNGGNFGVKDQTRRSQAKLIQNNANKKVSRGGVWKNGLISINEKAKKEHPFCKKYPILRPLGWIIVVVQYLIRVIAGKRNNVFAKKIYSDALNRQSIYSQLKLFESGDD